MELDIFSQGKEYISASRAAKKTGYASDYIGQLCRAGKIAGKLIDRTWYVDFDSLIRHKKTRQLGKPRITRSLLARESSILKIQEHPVEIIPSGSLRDLTLTYGPDEGVLLPLLAKKVVLPMRGSARMWQKQIIMVTISLILFVSGTLALAPFSTAHSSANQVAAASVLSALSDSVDFMLSGFRNLRNIAFGAPSSKNLETPNTSGFAQSSEAPLAQTLEPAPQALAEKSMPIDPVSYKVGLKSELESYIESRLTQIASPEPRIVYTMTSPPTNTTFLREEILLADTRPTVTRQSTNDVDSVSKAVARILNGSSFTDPSISGGSFSNSSIEGPSGDFDTLAFGDASGTNLIFSYATGTAATTTSFFSTTASSSNLFSTLASFGNATSSTFAVTGDDAGLTFYGSGNHDIAVAGGTLRIGATTIIGNILPVDSTIDIGASGMRFDKIYADEINASTIAGTISGGNVSAESIRINSDNATADTEDSFLEFERGTVLPNALLTWDSTNKRFTLNAGLSLVSGIGAGALGIGTTSPYAKLAISANVSDSFPVLFTVASTTGGTATTTHLTVLNNGNVGVGTSTPGARFDVYTTNGTGVAINSRGILQVSDALTGVLSFTTSGNASLINTGIAGDSTNNTLVFKTSSTEWAKITNTGSFGIGTSSPSYKLSVSGDAFFDGGTLRASSIVATSTLAAAYASTTVFQSSSDAYLATAGGRVGIGTTTPSSPLTIALSTGPQLTLTDGTTGSLPFAFRQKGSTLYIATSSQTSFATSTNTLLTIDGTTGNVGIGIANPSAAKAVVRANGTTLSSTSFLVEDSSGVDTLAVRDDGSIAFGKAALSATTNASLYALNGAADFSGQLIVTNNFGNGISAGVGLLGGEIRYAGTQEFSNAKGISIIAGSSNTNTSTVVQGIVSSARISAAAGRATTLIGGVFDVNTDNGTGGTITTAAGLKSTVLTTSGVTATNAYGLQVNDFTNAGTMTNTFGIRIGDITTGTQTNRPFSFYASDADAFNYFAGSTMIGTTTPAHQLTIASSTGPQLTLTDGTTGSLPFAFRQKGSTLYIATSSQTSFATSTNTLLTIDGTTGNVGIGTTSPWVTLSVVGRVAFPTLSNNATGYYACINTAGGGAELATSTTACGASSIRYKENVQDLTYGLTQVLEMRPVSFDWKKDFMPDGTHQVGFIAEEMQSIIPEIIGRDINGQVMNMDYPKLTSVLTRAIQDIAKITGLFKDNLITWLGDTGNGIQDFFANRVHTKELCVSDGSSETCLTKAQLDSLIAASGAGYSTGSGEASDIEIISPTPLSDDSASSTPPTDDGTASSTPETSPTPPLESSPEPGA